MENHPFLILGWAFFRLIAAVMMFLWFYQMTKF